MSNKPIVRIISQSDRGLAVCAAAARLSTTPHAAHVLAGERRGDERDRTLVRKVLSSGHRSLIEHHTFTVSLDNVSVLVEQFLIECRLCSFTVKSRRYVNFEDAGFYRPSLAPQLAQDYERAMTERFSDYARLIALGIPREDARFVLPYCFFSSLYLSANAREMCLLIGHMLYGRGRRFPEIRAVGQLLADQFEQIYPGVLQVGRSAFENCAAEPENRSLAAVQPCQGDISLLAGPEDARALLAGAMAFSGRFAPGDMRALVRDARPRELETLHYTFILRDVSLACVTHIARHRMQCALFMPTACAVNRQRYVLPETIARNEPALALYRQAFARQREEARHLLGSGLPSQDLGYLALSGLTVEVMTTMNARELLHFMKLRTCTRAQWEIRALAGQMLSALRERDPELFGLYGPSCFITGYCPEGRLSCGRAPQPADQPDAQ